MENQEHKEAVMFQDYYESILTYIDVYKPSVKEALTFIGALINSIIDLVDMEEHEKKFYINIYNKLLLKKIQDKVNQEDLALNIV